MIRETEGSKGTNMAEGGDAGVLGQLDSSRAAANGSPKGELMSQSFCNVHADKR